MSDMLCELCGDATPTRLLHQDPEHGWEALCPACAVLQSPRVPCEPWPVAIGGDMARAGSERTVLTVYEDNRLVEVRVIS